MAAGSQDVGSGSPAVAIAQLSVQADGCQVAPGLGPADSAIIADASADPWILAADLINEGEHGMDSSAILVSPERDLLINDYACEHVQLAVTDPHTGSQDPLCRHHPAGPMDLVCRQQLCHRHPGDAAQLTADGFWDIGETIEDLARPRGVSRTPWVSHPPTRGARPEAAMTLPRPRLAD